MLISEFSKYLSEANSGSLKAVNELEIEETLGKSVEREPSEFNCKTKFLLLFRSVISSTYRDFGSLSETDEGALTFLESNFLVVCGSWILFERSLVHLKH